jgi:serine protease
MALCLCLTAPSASAWQPNDALWHRQWGMRAIGMETAWEYNFGGRPDVKVAVVDTGVDWNIPDFADTRFDLENAWDYVDDDAQPYDEYGHGTHVAATIAQSTNNGVGAAGIAFRTTILPIRVLDEYGTGSVSDVAQGVRRAVDAGADIINLSMGSSFSSTALYSACEYAEQNGVLVVASAGNNWPFDLLPDFPAWYSNTLVVGGMGRNLHVWPYSQYAWDYSGPGLSAPGEYICQEIYDPALVDRAWVEASGTSTSAAFVSGVAALALSEAMDLGIEIPGENSSRVDYFRALLFGTAQDFGLSGPDYDYGWGMVRADWAMQHLQSIAPAQPEPTHEPTPEPAPEPEPEPDNPVSGPGDDNNDFNNDDGR